MAGVLLTGAALLALPAAATAPSPAVDGPRFWVETISVAGAEHVAPELVIAAARLEVERAYGEAELRAAVGRVHRLPFVLAADFALRRGSVRGRYRLLITIEETRRLFFGGELSLARFDPPLALDRGDPTELGVQPAPFVGARFFPGRYDLLYAALGGAGGVQLGYDRHDLFGRGGLLRVAYQHDAGDSVSIPPLALDPTLSAWREESGSDRLSLDLIVPIRGDHAFELHAAYRRGARGLRRELSDARDRLADGAVAPASTFELDDSRYRELSLAWRFDTTDDPIFPRRGDRLRAGIDYRGLRADLRLAVVDPPSATPLAAPETRHWRLLAGAERHWPIGRRQSVTLGLRAAAGRSRIEQLPGRSAADLDTWEASLTVAHALDLWPHGDARGELRWENRAGVASESVSPSLPGFLDRFETQTFQSSLVWRTGWGVVRFGFRLVRLAEGG